ncbi:MAG: redoxin domain-containing protein [Rhodoglobus sp.]
MTLSVGQRATAFALSDQFGQIFEFGADQNPSSVFVVFVPLAFSPVCSTEIDKLNAHRHIFSDAGIELVVISVDSKATLRAWADAGNIQLRLLADFWPHGAVADAFGVLLHDKGFAGRTSFLLDRDGTVLNIVTSPVDSPRNFAEYEAAIAAFRSRQG